MNRVYLCGNLGRDPELRYAKSGKAVLNFSLATSRGKKEDRSTDWHRCVVFGDDAEEWAEVLGKGSRVMLSGRISYRSYTDREGVEKQSTDIIVERIALASTGRGKKKEEVEDDIPF